MAAAAGRFERTVYEAGRRAQVFLSLAFLVLLPFYRQPAGDARLAPHARAVVRHHRPHHLQQPVHRPDGPAGRAALPVAALARGARRHRRQAHPAAGQRRHARCCASSTREIPYDQIDRGRDALRAVRRTLAPVLLRATRLVTKDGQHVRLGNVNEDNVDAPCPSPRSAPSIAERAGVEHRRRRHWCAAPSSSRVLGLHRPQDAARGEPAADRGRDGRDQRPPCARHALSGDRDGRADGRRHRHRRVHGAAHVVRHGRACSGPAKKRK